jgi:hypothetical protein
VAPYTYTEFTNSPGYGAVIDSQTVDGFTAPLQVEISDANGSLGKVGNPVKLTREDVITAYKPFINALSDAGKANFLDLQYSKNGGGLLNPGAYLNDISDQGEFVNIESTLNSSFDAELNTLFATNGLSIQGVSETGIAAQVYTSSSVTQALPGSPFSHQALKLTGDSNTFYVYNPVGLCFLTDNGSAIQGSIDGLTLTFTNPLSEANIQPKMYISGAGIPANMMWVKTVNKTGSQITSVVLDYKLGTLPPNSVYTILPELGVSPAGQPTFTGSVVDNTLTLETPTSDTTDIKVGYYVQGAGLAGIVSITAVNTNQKGEIVSVTIAMSLGQPTPNSQYYFSKLKGMFMTSGNMVFANQGLFAYTGDVTNANEQSVLLNLQNQMVTALNRGVANGEPTSGTGAFTSTYWGTESNWYPEGITQNLFSLFMHTGSAQQATTLDNKPFIMSVPIFLQSAEPDSCARGTIMGQAYGFAYDENPMFVAGQADVPSKFDPVPESTTTITITLTEWKKPS